MISDFHVAAKQLMERQRKLDLDDLANEMAGRETGRNSRFRNKEHTSSEAAKRRRVSAQAQLSALDQLLQNDPEYAKLYNETMDILSQAERAVDTALKQAASALKQSSEELQNILDNASQLSDGRKVFKDENGQVWTEDGKLVPEEEAQSIVWKEGSPSREEYLKQKQLYQDHQRRYDDLYDRRYNVLGGIRDRMEDKENPVQKEELESVQEVLAENKNAATQHEAELKHNSNEPKGDISSELPIPELK